MSVVQPGSSLLTPDTVAIVMGGGRGSRLYPLTRDRSKPAVPLGGKFRFIDVALSNCINSGLRRIFVLTQYNSSSLNNHVAFTYKFDSFSRGFVTILAAEQGNDRDHGWFEGTADSLRKSLRYLQEPSFRHVLILPGDHLCRINFNHLMNLHAQNEADVCLCAALVDRENAPKFRIIRVAPDGRVLTLHRKPTDPGLLDELALRGEDNEERFLAVMGVYLFRKEVLEDLLRGSRDQDLGRDTLPRLLEMRCYAYVFRDYWRDIGTISSFYHASLDLTAECPPFAFQHPSAPIYTHGRSLPASQIFNSTLDGAVVADGVVVRNSYIERSVIGVRARLEPGCRVLHSVVFGADTYETAEQREQARVRGLPPMGIGAGSTIRNAILDKNVRIGEDCQILNEAGIQHADGPFYAIRDGIVVIPKGAVVPMGSRV